MIAPLMRYCRSCGTPTMVRPTKIKPQHHNADNDTSDLTDAAHEGHAADDAGRDGVQLIVQAGVGRVGADTCALDEAGKTIHSAGQGENAHRHAEHIDAGNSGGLLIGAQSEHVLAKGGLVPDEPHDRRQHDGEQHIVGDGRTADAEQAALDKAGVGRVQVGDSHTLVVALLDIQKQHGVEDQLGAQSHDEGVQLEFCHEEAVEAADRRADEHGKHNDHGNGQSTDLRPHLVGHVSGVLQQRCRDTGGDTHGTACGQVGTGQHDTAADAQCGRQIGRRLGEDVDEGCGFDEVGVLDGDVNDRNGHDDEQCVI